VVNMGWPAQSDKEIHVEEAYHPSSSASRTISGVIGAESGRTSKVGRPVAVDDECRSASPRRANSETMEPSERPCSRDNVRATAKTWSSITSVVRMS